jgi:hypothetical protein
MTHSELVEIARQWLIRRKRCAIVTTEVATCASEQPDALGWNGWHSTLVECKVSRSDFRADSEKHFRQFPANGMGCERYFLIPKGLVARDEIPVKWGVLEYDGKRVKIARKSEHHEHRPQAEILILSSLLRRIGQAAPSGVSIKCYDMRTGNRCTLTLGDDDSEFEPEPISSPRSSIPLNSESSVKDVGAERFGKVGK